MKCQQLGAAVSHLRGSFNRRAAPVQKLSTPELYAWFFADSGLFTSEWLLDTYYCLFQKHNPRSVSYLIQEIEESAP